MSGTTGPEHDPGIRKALAVVSDVCDPDEAPAAYAALYAAFADWHRRETVLLTDLIDLLPSVCAVEHGEDPDAADYCTVTFWTDDCDQFEMTGPDLIQVLRAGFQAQLDAAARQMEDDEGLNNG